MANMRNRYCENCKFGGINKQSMSELVCDNFEYRLLLPEVKLYSHILNPNNDCEYYSRRWWKVWASK